MSAYACVSPLLIPVNKLFDYEIPADLAGQVGPGTFVVAPFGPRRIFGLVVKVSAATEVEKTKPIAGVVSELKPLSRDLLGLCLWISRFYLCPLYSVLEAAMPFGGRMSKLGIDEQSFERLKRRILQRRNASLAPGWEAAVEKAGKKLGAAQQKAIEYLSARPDGAACSELAEAIGATSATLKSLEKRGIAVVEYRAIGLCPVAAQEREPHFKLTDTQREAFEKIDAAIKAKRQETFLLRGITGSGKTEVYIHASESAIAEGRRVIALVPEIALATQIIERFSRRFPGRVAIWHSSLTFAERLHEWEQIAEGAVDIVIGARSACFAPLENVGLIIVDEEQEGAYKQEHMPRYHARESILHRAKAVGCPVVMGSATPAVETNYAAQTGKFTPLALEGRAASASLPEVRVVDLRKEKGKHLTSTLSPLIIGALRENLERGEQSLVYLNLRGYSRYVQCHRCGQTANCPNCSVAMRYHKKNDALICHLCDHAEKPIEICPDCGSANVRRMGMGTEKVYAQILREFKDARVERMDRDTVQRRGEHQRIVTACEKNEIDILVGTQMIAKGLDFANVTLVAVISGDIILNMPDFRASERTFQILTQVAGRAGRREKPGRVIIQTFNPEHPAIESARRHDYDTFYEQELPVRREALFPPFARLVKFVFAHEDQNGSRQAAIRFAERLRKLSAEAAGGAAAPSVLGPAEAPMHKVNNRYRWFVALRGERISDLIAVARKALVELGPEETDMATVDVDPMSML